MSTFICSLFAFASIKLFLLYLFRLQSNQAAARVFCCAYSPTSATINHPEDIKFIRYFFFFKPVQSYG